MFNTTTRIAEDIRPYDVVKIDRSKFDIFFIAHYEKKTELHMRNLKTDDVMSMFVPNDRLMTIIRRK